MSEFSHSKKIQSVKGQDAREPARAATTLRRIAVLGAGFSGTMVAVHLLAQTGTPVDVSLVERTGRWARGVAYGTHDPSHLLNVPAAKMSAFTSRPDHFAYWLQERPERLAGRSPTAAAAMFASRMLYGQYLEGLLREAQEHGPTGTRLTEYADEAVGIECAHSGVTVRLASGRCLEADRVVLALGNFPSGAGSVWDQGALEHVRGGDDLLILGSGLTMVDTVITLKERGHTGRIHVISRRGLLPQTFAPIVSCQPALIPDEGQPLLKQVKRLRAEIRSAAAQGTNWQSVFASLRQTTPELWHALPPAERARFLRHLKAHWDTHRHQMSPEIGEKIHSWIARGELSVVAARLVSTCSAGGGFQATIRRRGRQELETIAIRHVINCTGVEGDFRRLAHPLIESLRSQGLIRPDPLGLGFETSAEGRVKDAAGTPSDLLLAIGSVRRGDLWESVAVPELRGQAEQLARIALG